MAWIAQLAPTLVGLLGAAIGWALKSRLEAKRRAQEALRDERAQVYIDILMPFIRVFTDLSPERQQEALTEVKSLEYRKLAFRLALIGDDEVVRTWNGLWSLLYRMERDDSPSPSALLLGIGDVLLAIRKSLGNADTTLSNKDMLRWMIKDFDTQESA